MKKSWMLFLIVFLAGAVNEIQAVRGHRENMEQQKARNHVMSVEDEKKSAIVKETVGWYCCLIPRCRTRHLGALQETIKVGDTIRYFEPSHGIDGFSTIERHYAPDMYECWKIVDIDTQKKRFKELFVNDRCLTKDEKNYEDIQAKMMRDK